MNIRRAKAEDAETIATYLLMAMEDIVYDFIGQTNRAAALAFLHHFVQKEDNQYSYQNCWVVQNHHRVVAAVNIYDGACLKDLRAPIAHYIETHFQKRFEPEDETAAGEFYIDALAVDPEQRGKGIGAKLLEHVRHTYVIQDHKTIGLLVDVDNPRAQQLYLQLGFKDVDEKTLAGKTLRHLQIHPTD